MYFDAWNICQEPPPFKLENQLHKASLKYLYCSKSCKVVSVQIMKKLKVLNQPVSLLTKISSQKNPSYVGSHQKTQGKDTLKVLWLPSSPHLAL